MPTCVPCSTCSKAMLAHMFSNPCVGPCSLSPCCSTLIKKKIKLSSYIRKFRMEQLQSHIQLTASSYMVKYLRMSSYIRTPFLVYDFATACSTLNFLIYEENLIFFLISVWLHVWRVWRVRCKDKTQSFYCRPYKSV